MSEPKAQVDECPVCGAKLTTLGQCPRAFDHVPFGASLGPAPSEPLTDEARELAQRLEDHSGRMSIGKLPRNSDEWEAMTLDLLSAASALRHPAPSEALEGLIEKHPLDALLAIADRLLAEFYPESVFPDVSDEPATGDSGPQLIRAVRRARADLVRDALPEGTRE